MTRSERSLLRIFFVTLAAAIVAVGSDMYLERLSRLDAEFLSLQKEATRYIQAGQSSESRLAADLSARFFSPGSLPDSLAFASLMQGALKESGLKVAESRVTENDQSANYLQFRVSGEIESWFMFLRLARGKDDKALFRSLSIVKREGSTYAIAFEVGHAVLP